MSKRENQKIVEANIEDKKDFDEYFSSPGKASFVVKREENEITVITLEFKRVYGHGVGCATISSEKYKALYGNSEDFKNLVDKGRISKKREDVEKWFIKSPLILK